MKERILVPFQETDDTETIPWEPGKFARLHGIKDIPGKIVKSYKIEDLTYWGHERIEGLEDLERQFKNDDAFFNQYFEGYIPKHEFVITGSKTKKDEPIASTLELYVVSDEVQQRRFQSEKEEEWFCQEVEEFMVQSCEAFADSITIESDNDPDYPEQQATGRFPDLKIKHLIYGTTKNDSKPRTYFVDQYPIKVGRYFEFGQQINNLTAFLWGLRRYDCKKVNNSMEKLGKKIKRLGASTQ